MAAVFGEGLVATEKRSPLLAKDDYKIVREDGLPVSTEQPSPLIKRPLGAPVPLPSRPHVNGQSVNSNLAAATPKFNVTAVEKRAEPAPDLREIDPPRNTIIRLPSYVVQEEKPPVFKDRELPTAHGRLEMALQKYPGLRFGSFWIFRNDGVALAMLAEEERLQRMKEMGDLLTLLPVSQQRQVKPVVERTFMRNRDWP